MFITKTLAFPHLDGTDCIKISKINDGENSLLYSILRELIWQSEFDLSDDDLLAHICIKKGLFTYSEWQNLIIGYIQRVGAIDYAVDSTKRRLNLEETVFQMSGFTGMVTGDCYKMLCSLCARELVFAKKEAFIQTFGKEPREYIEDLWIELKKMMEKGTIVAEFTHELLSTKHHTMK